MTESVFGGTLKPFFDSIGHAQSFEAGSDGFEG
jgi:hypothetical protein